MLPARDQPVDQQDDQGSDDCRDPCGQLEEPVDRVDPKYVLAEPPAEKTADDADQRRHDAATGITPRHQKLRDDPGEQSHQNPSEDAHNGLPYSKNVLHVLFSRAVHRTSPPRRRAPPGLVGHFSRRRTCGCGARRLTCRASSSRGVPDLARAPGRNASAKPGPAFSSASRVSIGGTGFVGGRLAAVPRPAVGRNRLSGGRDQADLHTALGGRARVRRRARG